MTRVLVLPLLPLASCHAQASKSCSDEVYLALVAKCATAAKACRVNGGTTEECGAVCDGEADAWAKRCGQ